MRRLAVLLSVAFLALVSPNLRAAPTVVGDLNNFDTINDTGQTTYGFEIEIDGIHSTDISYTFDWNHYGVPVIREDNSNPFLPKVFIRYESTKDANGNFGANNSFTNVAIPSITPPSGHSCTDPTVNEGCEHFGVGYFGSPAAVAYHWLIDDGAGALVRFGTPVKVATPTFVYTPPIAGAPANVVAAIPAPVVPIPVGKEFGEPSWVKVIKTTTHNARPVEIQDLISDDGDGDLLPDWQNGEPSEVETEWKLLQANFGANPDKAGLDGVADDMGDGSEQVTRRYEFYHYGAAANTIDGETGEAMCSEVNPTTDPTDTGNYLHGVGSSVGVTDANGDTYYVDCSAQVVVGNFIGAQMAGFAAAAPLGLIDHLQEGEAGVAYTARTVVVGGAGPYVIAIDGGNLPPGLSLGSDGILTGTPTAGGDYPFTVVATDTDNVSVSRAYSLHVIGTPAPQVDLIVQKLGSGSGDVTGSGMDCGLNCTIHLDQGTLVSLTATPDAGSVFAGWSGACTGTGVCSFTLNASSTVEATFTRQWPLTVTKLGTGSGTVTGTGISCGATCDALFDDGTSVTLSAAATTGSFFTGWGGDCSGTDNCTTTMSAARSITATFVPATQLYTLTVSVTGSGTVTSTPKGISCGRQCSKSYPVGMVVTLTAKTTKKQVFVGWSGACSGTSPTCSVPMLGNRTANAIFQ